MRSIVDGVPVRDAARLIRPLIGLTQKQADAVFTRWLQKGDAAAGRYAAQLLRHRAQTIARTETIRASVDGQLAIWKAAQAQGLLPNHARKRWIVTPDDRLCPRCAPLQGVEVQLHQTFPGGVSGPPLHPNCRCAVSVVTASQRRVA
jgi:SPP1 gp7 family putative phage head morphogenesis protein